MAVVFSINILSTNLKESKEHFFVGEETGGAYNGTVASLCLE
jgi:hypothetical protein